jgi:hypothetical protein
MGTASRSETPLCPIAAQFAGKIHEIVFIGLEPTPTRGQISQAKYLLQEEYHTWRRSIPASHLPGAFPQHICVREVYEDS